MKKYVLIPLAAVMLAGASRGHHAAPNPDAILIAKAKIAVAANLKDPSSVQFRNIHVVPSTLNSRKVCGDINAKNSYGAYVGFEEFVYDGASNTALTKSDADKSTFYFVHSGC